MGLLSDFFETGYIGENKSTWLNKALPFVAGPIGGPLASGLRQGSEYKDRQKELTGDIRSLTEQLNASAQDFNTQRAKDIAESRTALGQYGSDVSRALSDYQKGITSGISERMLGLKNLQQSFGQDYSTQEKLLQDYLTKNYYQDYLQSPQAQAVLRQLQNQYQDVIQSTRGNAIKSGATPGAEVAARTKTAKAYGGDVLNLSVQGEQKKENVFQNYLNNLNTLTQQKQSGQRYIQEAGTNLFGTQANTLGNVLQGQTNLAGTQYTGLRDILNSSAQNDLAFQNMINNILNTKMAMFESNKQSKQYQSQQQSNLFSNLGDIALQALPLLLAESDIRFKKDIKELGKVKDVYIYSFKYIFGPDISHIGVMAQEIEPILPDAIKELNGLKYVDYSKVFEYFNN